MTNKSLSKSFRMLSALTLLFLAACEGSGDETGKNGEEMVEVQQAVLDVCTRKISMYVLKYDRTKNNMGKCSCLIPNMSIGLSLKQMVFAVDSLETIFKANVLSRPPRGRKILDYERLKKKSEKVKRDFAESYKTHQLSEDEASDVVKGLMSAMRLCTEGK